ncbi:MAG: hypothetical protein J6C44_06295 [Muribaculaceae bacterium]|nr:hypothetical protein [Muribaculaceae bacterium]MBO5187491.1 hypothetical protein [Prevotella sp.]
MRTATTLIIALLLFFGLQSCSTAKKATTKQETHQETAATISQETAATETGAAYLDQATLEQILQRYNVVVDFERWDFDTTGQEGTPTDSLPTSAAFNQEGSRRDKPPDAGRPKSFTKGTVTINAEGSQTRATQTRAGAQVNKTDSTATVAAVQKKADNKAETKEQKKASSTPTILIIFLCLGAGLVIWRTIARWKA